MVEEGLCNLIKTGIASAYPSLTGGFPSQLPPNFISSANPWSWTWRSIISEPLYLLAGQDSLTSWEVQLDCHGFTMNHAQGLARAIDGVLRGSWAGVLTDADSTRVTGIFRLPSFVDGFSDANRSYVRSLEYKVIYYDGPIKPVITLISPNEGSSDGGDLITITGAGFTGATAIHFGSFVPPILSGGTDTHIQFTSPSVPFGIYEVTVIAPGGTSNIRHFGVGIDISGFGPNY
jgi:hypothetical protein